MELLVAQALKFYSCFVIVDMSEIPNEPFPFFIYIIISGSILAGIFEWIRYYFTRKREEYIDLSKHRMDVISKSSPYLFQIATYAYRLHQELEKSNMDAVQCLYHLCCFFYARNRIFISVGGIQLDDLSAEDAISSLINDIHEIISIGVGLESIHIMQKLVDENHDYHSFKTCTIPNNSQFYNDFHRWLSTVDKKILNGFRNELCVQVMVRSEAKYISNR
jgi:hypothetical protein